MADLNPLGSEKLQGDAKLQRILELAYYNNNKKTSTSKAELVKESKTGGVYGIVKEKDGYYVKRGLNESSLDYIGGVFMKNKNRFSSYAEAFKRLDLIKGQEELNEATKYVLKQNKPAENEAPAAEPTMDAAPAPAPAAEPTAATEPTPDAGEAPIPDMGGEEPKSDMSGDDESAESKRSDYMEEIQKFAGKLGQELRDQHQKLESDDIKYVLNMIISAVDLDKLSDEDIEDIGKKFERDEEQGGEEEPTGEPAPEETPAEEPAPEQGNSELGEGMDALEYFVETGAPSQQDEDVSLTNYMDQTESLDGDHGDMGEEKSEEDEIKEIDLEEIKNAIGETLSKYFK
jgi:hypothetical protein